MDRGRLRKFSLHGTLLQMVYGYWRKLVLQLLQGIFHLVLYENPRTDYERGHQLVRSTLLQRFRETSASSSLSDRLGRDIINGEDLGLGETFLHGLQDLPLQANCKTQPSASATRQISVTASSSRESIAEWDPVPARNRHQA